MITDESPESTSEDTPDKDSNSQDAEILRVAKERFKIAEEAEADQRKLTEEDLKFSNGEQWLEADLRSRAEDGRPSLVINRMPGFIHQVSNDIRQNRPAIKVSPVDDAADKDTAKILQGIIRHIEYSSNADNAYDTATDSAIRGGYGYFRIVTEYNDARSFDQDIKIKRVPDRFAVYLDPSYQEPDGSDSEWGFVTEQVSVESFKARYPTAKTKTAEEFDAIASDLGDWYQDKTVRVTEYFWKEYKAKTIYRLETGVIVDSLVEGDVVVDQRETTVPEIHWAKLNGCEVLEKTTWLGSWIPIIPVLGEELVINGKKFLSGVIRHAKDSQRMYNYWKSAETEAIANAPRAPYIGAEGSFEGHEAQWRMAAKKNIPYLQYKPKTVGANMLPPPQRQTFEPAIAAISQAAMMAADDMKATTSIYDAAMGARSNENSGVAIQRRANQAQTSNFHFVDNLSKSIRHAGRIVVELIPKIYDTPRAIRILGEDGSEEIVRVNDMFQVAEGQEKPVDLNKGKYDVTVSVGPSYETKRQEAVQSMLEFSKVMPMHAPIFGDLIAKSMDWQMSDDIAARIKKNIDPKFQDDAKNGPAEIPPQVQAQLQQLGQTNQQLTQQLNEVSDTLKTKRLEIESKERIALAEMETKMLIEKLKLQTEDARVLFDAQLRQLDQAQNMNNQVLNVPEQSAGPDQALPPFQDDFQQQLPGELPPEFSMEQP